MLGGRGEDAEAGPEVPCRPPWHWDVCVERLADLASTRAELLELRSSLRRNIHMLCSTFRYYCRLGPTTQGANSDDFVTVRPTQAALEEEANHVALGASERLFGSLSISRADGEEDELLAGRPPEASVTPSSDTVIVLGALFAQSVSVLPFNVSWFSKGALPSML